MRSSHCDYDDWDEAFHVCMSAGGMELKQLISKNDGQAQREINNIILKCESSKVTLAKSKNKNMELLLV